jgi:hypothetical protein
MADITKLAATNGGNLKAAEIGYITHMLTQASRSNPAAMTQLMNRGAQMGLIGPLLMRGQ